MMNQGVLAVELTNLKGHVPTTGDLKGKLLKTMKAARLHCFMAVGDDEQFRCAVGAVMNHYGEDSPEWKRLSKELEALRDLSALMSGVPVDMERMAESASQEKHIGLMGLWHKSADAKPA